MRVLQAVSGKFHFVKYTSIISSMIDFTFLYSGKPSDRYVDKEKNLWLFFTLLHILIKILPDRFFSISLRISYFTWRISLYLFSPRGGRKVDVVHFLCHGYSYKTLKNIYPDSIMLGHVVNAHPAVQTSLINKSLAEAGLESISIDSHRCSIDEKILDEVEKSDYILSPSQFVTESYVKNGFDKSKFITINYGLEKDISVSQLESGNVDYRCNPIKLICVGQVIPRKGQLLLMQAVEAVRKLGLVIDVTLVGRADQRYLEVIKGFSENFNHIEHVPNKELTSSLSKYDLFVLPSYEDGFAVSVSEAISAKVPVIVSSAVGAADLLADKKHSVFEVGEVSDLISKIENFAYGNYIERITQCTSWKGYSENLVRCYRELGERNAAD